MRIERDGEWCVWRTGLKVTVVAITTADYFLTSIDTFDMERIVSVQKTGVPFIFILSLY